MSKKGIKSVLNIGSAVSNAAKKLKNKRNEKGNATNYFTPLSSNQKKAPSETQQKSKNQKINTIIGTTAATSAIAIPVTVALMNKDKGLARKADQAYANDANTFTFKSKKYKTPSKTTLNKIPKVVLRPKKVKKVEQKTKDKKKFFTGAGGKKSKVEAVFVKGNKT